MTIAALEALLAESVEDARARESRAFDDASRGRPIVLMGAGGLGRKTLAGLRASGVEPLAFVDNNASRQGTSIDGLQVLSPSDAAQRFGRNAAFCVTIWGANSPHRFAHSREQLAALGCDVVVPFPLLFWKYPEALLPYYLIDLPHRLLEQRDGVRAAWSLWEDDASRAEYLAQLRLRLYADFDGLAHPVAHPQYFPPDLFAWRSDECLVDGGAFDGDTIRAVLALHGGSFGRIIAFEPDPLNCATLEATIAALPPAVRAKVEARQLALGAAQGSLAMSPTGTAASTVGAAADASSITMVPVEALDDVIGTERPTFLKLDVEGAEPEALLGARRTIATCAPVCAICVYHTQDHLWRVPLLMRELCGDAAFFLRPHNEEGFDVICYAVPRERLTLP